MALELSLRGQLCFLEGTIVFGHTNRAVSIWPGSHAKKKKREETKKNGVIVSEINRSFSRQGDRLLSAAKSVVTRGESNRVFALFNLGPSGSTGTILLLQFNQVESICVTETAGFKKERVAWSARVLAANYVGVEGTCLRAPGSAFSSSQKTAVTVTTLRAIISSPRCVLTGGFPALPEH